MSAEAVDTLAEPKSEDVVMSPKVEDTLAPTTEPKSEEAVVVKVEDTLAPTTEPKCEEAGVVKAEDTLAPTTEPKSEEDVSVSTVVPKVESNGSDNLTDLDKKIIKQVEFYYGDINLSRDKFLQEQIKLDDGWVPLEVMLRFNRLKSMCEDEAVVAAALRKSSSGLIEVSEDDKKIRRSPSKPVRVFTKELSDDIKFRSVYAKGFPLDVTLDQLMEFFETFGKIELVNMRKDQSKKFKGSCFIVFNDNDDAKKFLTTPDVKFNDVPLLLREFKHDYYQRKTDERKQQIAEKAKVKQEVLQKKEEDVMKQMVTGAVLAVENLPSGCSVENLRQFFGKFGDVKWVDIIKEDNKARIRYNEVDGAKTALEKAKESNDGKIVIESTEVTCSVLEGECEVEHWKNLIQSRRDKNSGKDRFKGGKRRGGGRRDGWRNAPQRKKPKKEEDEDDGDNDDAADSDGDSD